MKLWKCGFSAGNGFLIQSNNDPCHPNIVSNSIVKSLLHKQAVVEEESRSSEVIAHSPQQHPDTELDKHSGAESS